MTAAPEHPAAISDRMSRQISDLDPAETQEWRESLAGVVNHAGRHRARHLVLSVLQRARERQVGVPGLRGTDYINTISPESEPTFPGVERIERRIRAYIRWNAAIMVHRAQGHASPGIYARAYLEGRLSQGRLDGFRQELSHAGPAAACRPTPSPADAGLLGVPDRLHGPGRAQPDLPGSTRRIARGGPAARQQRREFATLS